MPNPALCLDNVNLEPSTQCNALIKWAEGSGDHPPLTAYNKDGKWTVGWGSTGPDIVEGTTVTLEEAASLLMRGVWGGAGAVRMRVKVPLGQAQFDALTSWTYNLGAGTLAGSTMLQVVNRGGSPEEVADQMRRWVYGPDGAGGRLVVLPGLVKRREAEARLYTTGELVLPT
jgi:lysozyme